MKNFKNSRSVSSGKDSLGVLVKPRDPAEESLTDIWRAVLGRRDFGVCDKFSALSGDRTTAAKLLYLTEEKLKVELPENAIDEDTTIELLAKKLWAGGGLAGSSCVVALAPMGPGIPLFCMHPAAGDVGCYLKMVRRLRTNGSQHPVYGIRMPLFDSQISMANSMPELASYYIHKIKSVQPAEPYMLLGYSMGGVIAFEMAKQLREQGKLVPFLGMLDSFIPSSIIPKDEAGYMTRYFSRAFSIEQLRSLSEFELMNAFRKQGIRSGILPDDAEISRAREVFEVIKHNINITESYKPEPCPGRICFFSASEGIPNKTRRNASLGWKKYIAEGVDVYYVPGNHHTMIRKAVHVQALAKPLLDTLTQASESFRW